MMITALRLTQSSHSLVQVSVALTRSQRHQNGPNEICVFSVRLDPVEHKLCKATVTLMQSRRKFKLCRVVTS